MKTASCRGNCQDKKAPGLGHGLEITLEQPSQPARKGQSDAVAWCPIRRCGGGVVDIEDLVHHVRGHAWTFVQHPKLDQGRLGCGGHPHGAADRSVFDGVGEQVDENLLDSMTVGSADHGLIVRGRFKPDLFFGGGRRASLNGRPDEPAAVDVPQDRAEPVFVPLDFTEEQDGLAPPHYRREALEAALETLLPASLWPVPTYAEMLFKF